MKNIIVYCVVLGVAIATPEQHTIFKEPINPEISKDTADFMKYLDSLSESER